MRDFDGLYLGGIILVIVSSALGLAKAKDSSKGKVPFFLTLAGAIALLVSYLVRKA